MERMIAGDSGAQRGDCGKTILRDCSGSRKRRYNISGTAALVFIPWKRFLQVQMMARGRLRTWARVISNLIYRRHTHGGWYHGKG